MITGGGEPTLMKRADLLQLVRTCRTRFTATIRHRLDLAAQTMSEQVTWRRPGRPLVRDPEESLRLLFPQELAAYLGSAGFEDVHLHGGFGRDPRAQLNG